MNNTELKKMNYKDQCTELTALTGQILFFYGPYRDREFSEKNPYSTLSTVKKYNSYVLWYGLIFSNNVSFNLHLKNYFEYAISVKN